MTTKYSLIFFIEQIGRLPDKAKSSDLRKSIEIPQAENSPQLICSSKLHKLSAHWIPSIALATTESCDNERVTQGQIFGEKRELMSV